MHSDFEKIVGSLDQLSTDLFHSKEDFTIEDVNRLVLDLVILQAQRVAGLDVKDLANITVGLRPDELVSPRFVHAIWHIHVKTRRLEFQGERGRAGDARSNAGPAADTPLGLDDRSPLGVHGECFLANRACAGTHPTLRTVKRDAPVGIEHERRHPIARPSVLGHAQGFCWAGLGARHVLASYTRL